MELINAIASLRSLAEWRSEFFTVADEVKEFGASEPLTVIDIDISNATQVANANDVFCCVVKIFRPFYYLFTLKQEESLSKQSGARQCHNIRVSIVAWERKGSGDN